MTETVSLHTVPQTSTGFGPVAHRFRRELAYLLSGLPLGLAAFTVAVAGFTLGVSALAVVIGLPVLAWTLRAAGTMADKERSRVAAVTGRAVPPRRPRPTGTGWAGALHAVREPRAWRDLAHPVVAFPVQVTTSSMALAWTLGGVGELLYGTWSWSLPQGPDDQGLVQLIFDTSSRTADIGFNTAIGVFLLATAVPVVRALAATQTRLARTLLTDRAA